MVLCSTISRPTWDSRPSRGNRSRRRLLILVVLLVLLILLLLLVVLRPLLPPLFLLGIALTFASSSYFGRTVVARGRCWCPWVSPSGHVGGADRLTACNYTTVYSLGNLTFIIFGPLLLVLVIGVWVTQLWIGRHGSRRRRCSCAILHDLPTFVPRKLGRWQVVFGGV